MSTTSNLWDGSERYITIKMKTLKILRESVIKKEITYKEYFIFMTLVEHLSTKTYFNSSNLTAKKLSEATGIPRNTLYSSIARIAKAVPSLMKIGKVLDDSINRYIFNPNQIKNSKYINVESFDSFPEDYEEEEWEED